jgi:PAS domain S-box-containing protein
MDFNEKRFKTVNDGMCRMLGYTKAELLAINPMDILDKESGKIFLDRIRKAQAGEAIAESIEYKAKKKDGTEMWGILHTKFEYSKGKIVGAFVVAHDITERKRAEVLLQRQAELLHLSYDAIIVWQPGGRIESWNKGAEELYGYSEEEAVGQVTHDLLKTIHPEPWPQIEKKLRERKSWEGELKHRTRDGREVTVSARHQIIQDADDVERVLETNRDITERKRAEARLAYLASFPERNTNPIMEVDLGGVVRYMNPAALNLFPDLREKGLTHPWLVDWANTVRPFREGQTDTGVRNVDVGQHTYQQTFYYAAPDPLVRIYGLDITERKKAEEGLKKAHEALQVHAGSLEAANKELESFSYSVSHDLLSPLRAIAGFTRMILDEKGATFDPETGRKFGIIQENAEKMGQLIDNLLRLSRLGRAELHQSKLDMGDLVREVLQEIRMTDPGREFMTEIGDLPAAQGDPAMIRQVFANLLSNAVKFTREKQGARIEVGSFERAGEQVYYVKDNGVGFDMKYYNLR